MDHRDGNRIYMIRSLMIILYFEKMMRGLAAITLLVITLRGFLLCLLDKRDMDRFQLPATIELPYADTKAGEGI